MRVDRGWAPVGATERITGYVRTIWPKGPFLFLSAPTVTTSGFFWAHWERKHWLFCTTYEDRPLLPPVTSSPPPLSLSAQWAPSFCAMCTCSVCRTSHSQKLTWVLFKRAKWKKWRQKWRKWMHSCFPHLILNVPKYIVSARWRRIHPVCQFCGDIASLLQLNTPQSFPSSLSLAHAQNI